MLEKIFKKEEIKVANRDLLHQILTLLQPSLKKIARKYIDVESIIKKYTLDDEYDQQEVDEEIDNTAINSVLDYLAITAPFIQKYITEELNNIGQIEETKVPGNEPGFVSITQPDGKNPFITIKQITNEVTGDIEGIEIELKKDKDDLNYNNKIVFKDEMVKSETTRYTDEGTLVKETEAIYLDGNRKDRVCEYMKTVNDEQVIHGYVSEITANATSIGWIPIGSSKYATYRYFDEINNTNDFIEIRNYSAERDPECRAYAMSELRKNLTKNCKTQQDPSKK